MNIEEIRKNAPIGATHYIKKPFCKIRYIRQSAYAGFFNNLNKDGSLHSICRDWIFWIKPL